MNFSKRIYSVCSLVVLLGISIGAAFGADAGPLRVGVAKIDLTPADPSGLTNLFQTHYTGVHDHIYARAIVLDNGVSSAAIIAVDSVEITDGTAMVAHISRETGIPTSNIIMAATHNHNAPMISLQNANGTWKSGPAAAGYVAKVEEDLVAGLKQAKANMQPARVGLASGLSSINVSRDELTAAGTYKLGVNPEGVSDKTVWVMKFESPTGEPIAMLINYAVHATVVGAKNSLLTGELPGATAGFVEQHYKDKNDKFVAVWTSGAAGDQAPAINMSSNSDPAKNFEVVDVLGRVLGEEVVRVADGIKNADAQPRIWGMEKTVTCPGQKVIGGGPDKPDAVRQIVDADPVNFRLSVLMIDRMAVTSISSEVVTKIYQHLRKESPFTDTMMITLANGRIGYIPDDATYNNPTFEVYGSPLKKGCGESTIVNGLVDMMRQY